MKKTKRITAGVILFLVVLSLSAGLYVANRFNLLPQKVYTAEDFEIVTLFSTEDFNGNGVDDYTDFLLGARADAENHPRYEGSYYEGGFPPDDIGVCTDVVWRAFKNAGYNLREMVDADAQLRPEAYTAIEKRDKNIDFRRVVNLRVFFEEYGVSLTVDVRQIGEWQPGDIVIFNGDKHIGIVSDKRNSDGEPYIIHNGGQPKREEDYLKRGNVTGHYRFDASKLEQSVLVKWKE